MVPYVSFEKLDRYGLTNAFSTKHGGVSTGIYKSMNLNFNCGDDEKLVLENFKRFSKAINVDFNKLIMSRQTHTTNVIRVSDEFCFKNGVYNNPFNDIDGLVTNDKSAVLVTSYADCVPLYFYDPINEAIGLSHSGWRGTVGNIAANTIKLMVDEFASKPENIVCVIGPSICKECYEVSKDLYDEFSKKYNIREMNDIFTRKNDEKYLLDLWKANYYNFINCGIKHENIQISGICTCCNSDKYFSHRATQGKRGGLCAFLSLKKVKEETNGRECCK